MLTREYAAALEAELRCIIRDARNQLDTYRAQSDAVIAALNARIAETEARLAMMEDDSIKRIDARLGGVRDGVDGAPGRDGIDGKDGRDGVNGEPGLPGADGAPGRDGLDGKDGRDVDRDAVAEMIRQQVEALPPPQDGVDGKDGSPGRDGLDGSPGRDGKDVDMDVVHTMVSAMVHAAVDAIPAPKDGRDGADGKDGAPGRMPIAVKWTDRVHYAGDVVTYNGGTYQAVTDTGRDPANPDDWACLASPGPAGRSYEHCGTWNATVEYRARDVVMIDGSTWVAKKDRPGSCPGDDWQLFAGKGSRGGIGPKGDRGDPGASIASADIDDQGMMTITLCDGTKVAADFYPALSRITK